MVGEIVENELLETGVRVMHVLRMGAPVELDAFLDVVPPFGRETLVSWADEEAMLGVHHLWLVWNVRELMDGRVYWWLRPGETLRDGIHEAATLFCVETGDWPEVAWVRAMPSGGQVEVEVDDGLVRVALLEAGWAVRGCGVVGLGNPPPTPPFSKGGKYDGGAE